MHWWCVLRIVCVICMCILKGTVKAWHCNKRGSPYLPDSFTSTRSSISQGTYETSIERKKSDVMNPIYTTMICLERKTKHVEVE